MLRSRPTCTTSTVWTTDRQNLLRESNPLQMHDRQPANSKTQQTAANLLQLLASHIGRPADGTLGLQGNRHGALQV